MANISISIEGIDQAISNLRYRPGSIKEKTILAIRDFYTSEASLKDLRSIDSDDLIKSIWDVGDNVSKIKTKRRNFSSVKSSINADLKKLSKKDLNTENITITDTNLFDMTEEAKSELLSSFTDAVKTGDINLDQATNLLKAVTDFLDNFQAEDTDTDSSNIVNQIKKILNKITEDVLSEEDLADTPGLKKMKSGDIDFDEVEDLEEDIELDEDEELEEVGELEEDVEEIELDEDEELEEVDELEEDIEEIELDDDEDIEEADDLDEGELDEIEDLDEDIEEIELDEDEELEVVDELEEDVEEIELDDDEDIEEVDDLDEGELEEIEDLDEDIEEIELDEDEELEEVDELDEDVEEIELDDDEEIDDLDEDELEEIEDLDEDIEEIELDEDEELEEIEELDEDELKALEEFREKKELAEHFDETLGEREKKYNTYVTVPEGEYTIGTKKSLKSSLELQQFNMPMVYIGCYPVTNSLFEIFIEETGYVTTAEKSGFGRVYHSRYKKDANGSTWNKNAGSEDVAGACWYKPFGPESTLHEKRNHPVVQVSVDDATAFSSWIGRRIPTEAEWEAAARTDRGNKYPWGNDLNAKALNIEQSGLSNTTSVDEYDAFANEFKIVDLLGNVMEWTSDMEIPPVKQIKPVQYCVAKGAAWNAKNDVTISSRALFKPGFTSNTIGFRCISEIFL